jgi:parvulin-like peptidyl-prolyl isomerase
MTSRGLMSTTVRFWLPLLLVVAAEAAPRTEAQGVLEQVVVTVNGDIISKNEIDERLRVTRSLAENTAEAEEPALLTRVLRDAVDEQLMMQRAAELGIAVADEDVNRVLETVKADSRVDSDDAFQALLEHEGMSLPILRANTRRRLVIEQVRLHLFSRISVSNDEALRYFNANRRELIHRERVTFRELRITVPRHGRVADAERDRALVNVVRARDQLASGIPFEAVAAAFSGPTSMKQGAAIGPVDMDDLEPPMRATLASLEPGAVSMPVETAEGYAFLKLEAHEAATTSGFHDSREQIVETLLNHKQLAALEELLARLRSAAILQWKRRDLQAAYDRPADYR